MVDKCTTKCKNDKCFAFETGECRILRDTKFGGKPCPFYKTKRKRDAECKRTKARLIALGIINIEEEF